MLSLLLNAPYYYDKCLFDITLWRVITIEQDQTFFSLHDEKEKKTQVWPHETTPVGYLIITTV